MKKRLRKKKHIGEFQVFGFEVCFTIDQALNTEEHNAVIDAFISDAIEAHGLIFGGGGGPISEGFVMLDKPNGSATQNHREEVRAWLERNAKIQDVWVGELRDAWHGWDD